MGERLSYIAKKIILGEGGISPKSSDWKDENKKRRIDADIKAEKERDKIAKRPEEKDSPTRNMVKDIATFILQGWHPEEAPQEERVSNPELMLTPGERATVESIERKMSKNAFRTSARFIYVAKKDVFFKPRLGFPFAFTNSLSNAGQYFGVGGINTKVVTMLKIFDKHNAYINKRNLLDVYKMRVNSDFPGVTNTFILNVEELATIFHFPGQDVAPGPSLDRMEYKKGSPPSTLPVEPL